MNQEQIQGLASKIETLFAFVYQLDEKQIQETIDNIDTKISGSVLFIAMGENIDFERMSKLKLRAEALLNLRKVLRETEGC